MDLDILNRLRIDPGKRTIGELLQDREIAAYEIARLRSEIARSVRHQVAAEPPKDDMANRRQTALAPGALLSIAEVRALLCISRSTIYKRLSDGTFPKPIRLGPRTNRWRRDAIETWRDGLTGSKDA
jgi:prophage regulatory protein